MKLSIARSDRKILAVALGLYVAAAIPLLFFPNGKGPLLFTGAILLFVVTVVLRRPEAREAIRKQCASAGDSVGALLGGVLLAAFYVVGCLVVIYALVKFVRWAWYN